MIEHVEDLTQSIVPSPLAGYALLFTATSRDAFIAESKRTKHPRGITGTYVFVSPDVPSNFVEGPSVLYVGEGILRNRLRRYRHHLEKGESCLLPHRAVHLGLAALLAAGQTVDVYVRESTKSEAQDEERRIVRDFHPLWNK